MQITLKLNKQDEKRLRECEQDVYAQLEESPTKEQLARALLRMALDAFFEDKGFEYLGSYED